MSEQGAFQRPVDKLPNAVLLFQEPRTVFVTRLRKAWTGVICSAVGEDTTPKRSPLRRGVTASSTGAVTLSVRPVSAQLTCTPVNENCTQNARECNLCLGKEISVAFTK